MGVFLDRAKSGNITNWEREKKEIEKQKKLQIEKENTKIVNRMTNAINNSKPSNNFLIYKPETKNQNVKTEPANNESQTVKVPTYQEHMKSIGVNVEPLTFKDTFEMQNKAGLNQKQIEFANPLKYVSAPVTNAALGSYKEMASIASGVNNIIKDLGDSEYAKSRGEFKSYFSMNKEKFDSYFKETNPSLRSQLERKTLTKDEELENAIKNYKKDKTIPETLRNINDDDLKDIIRDFLSDENIKKSEAKIDEFHSDINQKYYKRAKLVGENVGRMAFDSTLSGLGGAVGGAIGATVSTTSTIGKVFAKVAKIADNVNDFKKKHKVTSRALDILTPTKTTALTGFSTASNKYEENLKNNVDPKKALINALGTGYKTAITEKMGFSDIPGVSKVIQKGVTGSFSKNVGRIFLNYGLNTASEGYEEVLDNILGGIWDKMTVNPDLTFGEIFDPKTNAEAFAGGALVGGVLGGVGLAASMGAIKTDTENISEKIKMGNILNEELPDEYKLKPLNKNADVETVDSYTKELETAYKAYREEIKTDVVNSITTKALSGLELTESDINILVNNPDVFSKYAKKELPQNPEERKAFISQYADSKKADMQEFNYMVDSLSKKTGTTIEYDATLEEVEKLEDGTEKITVYDGYYDPVNNKIVVNPNSPNALKYIIFHELTHFAENKKGFEEYADILKESAFFKDYIIENYGTEEAFYDNVYERYKGVYKELNTENLNKALKSEMLAEINGVFINMDEAALRKIAKNDSKMQKIFKAIIDFFKELYYSVSGETDKAFALKMQNKFEKLLTAEKISETDDIVKYSVSEIVGKEKSYGIGVYLDSNLLTDLTEVERIEMVKEFVTTELAGEHFIAYDNNKDAVDIRIATKQEKIKTNNGRKKKVIKELYNKYSKFKIKQEAIVLIDELIANAKFEHPSKAKHKHGWLDNDGKNDWDIWTVYIQEKNKTVWEATLNIANTSNGEKILYDIDPIKMVEQASKSATSTTINNISQPGTIVNNNSMQNSEKNTKTKQFSISNNENTLTGEVRLPYNEYIQLREYVMSKNNSLKSVDKFGLKEIGDNFYIWENKSKTDFKVFSKIKIEGNEQLIKNIRSEIENGTITNTKGLDLLLERVSSRGGYDSSNNVVDEKTGGNGNYDKVYGRQPSSNAGYDSKQSTEDSRNIKRRYSITGTEIKENNSIIENSQTKNEVASQDDTNISLNMSEDERYKILKDKKITLTSIKIGEDVDIDFEYLENNIKSIVEKPLKNKLRSLGYLKKYKTDAIDVEFEFTGKGFGKSLHSQMSEYGGNFADFTKVILNLQELLNSSVLIEIHTDKGKGTNKEKRGLEKVYVLFSALKDQEKIIPIQFEIEQYLSEENRLYLSVALTKIEIGVMGNTAPEEQKATSLLPISNISISDIFSKINPIDRKFLKYVPNQFLNEEQIQAKNIVLEMDKKKYSTASNDSNIENGRRFSVSSTPNSQTFEKSNETSEQENFDLDEEYDERYERLVKQYRSIPTGENPYRDIEVPKRSSESKYVSRFARTLAEAEVMPEGQMDDFKRLIVEGKMSHEIISDKSAEKKAIDKMKNDGFWETFEQWQDNLGKRYDKNYIVQGQALFNQAATAGDVETSMKLAADLAMLATETGQNLQAVRMLKKMSPDGQLYCLERTVQRINNKLEENAAYKDKDKTNIKINPELAKKLLKSNSSEEMQNAVEEIQLDIAKQVPSTLEDKINAWRYLSMLGNPKTHIRNILGNAMFKPVIGIKDMLGAVIEKYVVTPEERTKSVFKSKKNIEFAKDDYKKLADELKGKNKYDMGKGIMENRAIFKNKVLETIRTKNNILLEAEDDFFFKSAYINAFSQAMTARKLTPLQLSLRSEEAQRQLESIRHYAANQAQTATFRDASSAVIAINKFRNDLKKTKAGRIAGIGLDAVIPFTKTPVNIVKRGIDYSPIGLVKGIIDTFTKVKKGKITATDAAEEISRGLTGSAIVALGWFLAKMGWLTGNDDEDKKKSAFDDMTGYQSYALNMGDVYYTVDWITPFSLPLFVGCEIYNITQEKGLDAVNGINAITRLADPIINLSMLSGINNTVKSSSYNGENAISGLGMTILSSYASQFIPTAFSQIAKTFDNNTRSIYHDKNSNIPEFLDETVQTLLKKIPGASALLQPKIDNFGREQKGEDNFLLRTFENFISPGYFSRRTVGEVENIINEIYNETGDNSVFPPSASKSITVSGVKKQLDADTYTKYAAKKGSIAYSILKDVVKLPKFKKLSTEEKVEIIEKVYRYANDVAKYEVMNIELKGNTKKIYNSGNAAYKLIHN